MTALRKGVAATALAISIVGGAEGLSLTTYQDVIGVWTGCYGETKGMKPGMRFTLNECRQMLIWSLREHESGMRKCLDVPDALPDKIYVAMLSGAYNFGTERFCSSSMARKINEGDLSGACDALLLYNKAGGKVINGLTNRRERERKLCREGLPREWFGS